MNESSKTNMISKLASDNRGRILAYFLLSVIILAALGIWVLMIIGNIWGKDKLADYVYDRDEPVEDDGELLQQNRPADIDVEEDEEDEEEPEDEKVMMVVPVFVGENSVAHKSQEVYSELDSIAKRYNCMAVSLAAYNDDTGEYYTYEYGFADAGTGRRITDTTKHRVASLSNLVTAICVMTLADENKIDLDADLNTYFDYNFRNPNHSDVKITPRMLLQHTSSIFDSGAYNMSRNRGSSESVQTIIESGNSFRRNVRPGTAFGYSNFGFAVLGSLCEVVSGMSLDTLARERIFDPLGIDAAFVPANLENKSDIAVIYESDHNIWRGVDSQLAVRASDNLGHDLHLASGNLTISATDYAKILGVITAGGMTADGTEVLSQEAVNAMLDTNFDSGLGYKQGLGIRYSEGNLIGDDDYYWHSGSSYGVFAQYIYNIAPNHGVVVITTGASIRRDAIGMIDACTELSQAALKVFDAAGIPAEQDTDAADGENIPAEG